MRPLTPSPPSISLPCMSMAVSVAGCVTWLVTPVSIQFTCLNPGSPSAILHNMAANDDLFKLTPYFAEGKQFLENDQIIAVFNRALGTQYPDRLVRHTYDSEGSHEHEESDAAFAARTQPDPLMTEAPEGVCDMKERGYTSCVRLCEDYLAFFRFVLHPMDKRAPAPDVTIQMSQQFHNHYYIEAAIVHYPLVSLRM